jgi:hypothetical protein
LSGLVSWPCSRFLIAASESSKEISIGSESDDFSRYVATQHYVVGIT